MKRNEDKKIGVSAADQVTAALHSVLESRTLMKHAQETLTKANKAHEVSLLQLQKLSNHYGQAK